ncbi:MAG: hypothetical protein GAK30_03670 [Paracidovorax wautersii]|uniref:Tripartite-type tricarboxylate transporter, receptor component TctC n=1 Tax=Paracidovorax wautersii TaxID=1177982 RepID=A0A7V8FKL4_9BURK|nr:MAG: hypothetical protein GAK30_03670 [Paracidovorax wautersii]
MSPFNLSRRAFTLGAAAGAIAFPLRSFARPDVLRLVVGFPPGGTLDFVARTIAQQFSHELQQQVIVENKGGANGVIGGEFVSRATPDMGTLWLSSVGAVAISRHLQKMTFDPLTDVTPVSLVVRNVEVLLVNVNAPYNTATELVAAARSGKPLTIASPGSGSVPHLALELLNHVAGTKMLHVPYRGGGPAVNDLMAGHVDGYFTDIPGVIGLLKSGRVKPIGLTAEDRHPLFPDIKTFKEQGIAGIDADNWNGLFAPKDSKPEDVARVSDALRRTLETPSVKAALDVSGAKPAPSSPAEMAALLKQDSAKWGKLIRERGITAD